MSDSFQATFRLLPFARLAAFAVFGTFAGFADLAQLVAKKEAKSYEIIALVYA